MYSAKKLRHVITLLLFSTMVLSACGGGGSEKVKQLSKKEIAIEKIMNFAENQNKPAPTLQDYIDAGVSGVTSKTLSDLNTLVSDLKPADVDSTSELETLTSQLNINIEPTADAGSDKSVQVNVEIHLEGAGNDADGKIVSYVWKKGKTVLAETKTLNYTPTKVGTDTLTLTVVDDDKASASDDVKILVTAIPKTPNKAPTAKAGANKTVELGKSVQLQGSGTDTDGSIISYQWKKGKTVLASKASYLYTPTKVGKETLTLTVKDNGGLYASSTVEITVIPAPIPDTTPPTITLSGSSSVEVEQGSIYVDAGATATDDKDGNISASIAKSGVGLVNTSAVVGTKFTIDYNVSDAAGNAATKVTRTITIIKPIPDTVDPVITLIGSGTIEVAKGGTYTDAGATALDNKDGNITANIIVGGDTVNTNAVIGTTFIITYNIKDAAQNAAIEVTRTVSIIDDPQQIPAISSATIQEYLSVINAARAEARDCGNHGSFPAADPVTWSTQLYKAAYEHSQDLSTSNTFDHLGSGTISDWTGYPQNKQSVFSERITNHGYVWARISENLSAGTYWDTAQEAVDSWIGSPGHCANLMDSGVTEVGMALSINTNAAYVHYWTQNFGRPR